LIPSDPLPVVLVAGVKAEGLASLTGNPCNCAAANAPAPSEVAKAQPYSRSLRHITAASTAPASGNSRVNRSPIAKAMLVSSNSPDA
jgi:hypothetical protein